MTEPGIPDWPALAFGEPLAQPDQRSCGASALVVARMMLDPSYAALVATGRQPLTGHTLPGDAVGRFRSEALALHRRVTGPVDAAGRLQLPWPRALGTPPWAVARQMSATGSAQHPAVAHSVRLAWRDRGGVFDRLAALTARRRPVPVYVGNSWSPRHVVLAVGTTGGRLRFYEPARGALVDVTREAFAGSRLGLAGWDRSWCVVTPD